MEPCAVSESRPGMSIHPTPSVAPRRILPMMDSASTDSELRHWLRWAAEGGNTPIFVRTVANAALIACSPDYALLRPVLVELKRLRRYMDTRHL